MIFGLPADAAQLKMSGVSTLLQEHLAGLILLQLLNKTEFHVANWQRWPQMVYAPE